VVKQGAAAGLVLATIGFGTPLTAQDAVVPEVDEALQRMLADIEAGMTPLAGGRFRMGDLSGRGFDDEKPVREVTVPPFYLSKYEVTFEQFDTYSRVAGRPRLSSQGMPRGSHPAMNVNWEEAQEMIAWLNEQTGRKYRLPSEAQWEYAAYDVVANVMAAAQRAGMVRMGFTNVAEFAE